MNAVDVERAVAATAAVTIEQALMLLRQKDTDPEIAVANAHTVMRVGVSRIDGLRAGLPAADPHRLTW